MWPLRTGVGAWPPGAVNGQSCKTQVTHGETGEARHGEHRPRAERGGEGRPGQMERGAEAADPVASPQAGGAVVADRDRRAQIQMLRGFMPACGNVCDSPTTPQGEGGPRARGARSPSACAGEAGAVRAPAVVMSGSPRSRGRAHGHASPASQSSRWAGG